MDNVSAIIRNMTIRERKDGRLEGRLTIDKKPKSFYGSTKAEIKNKAKCYLMKIENGYKDPKKIQLNDYIEYWLKKYKWGKIEEPSYNRLKSVYIHQIHNSIGEKWIGDITSDDIQELIDYRANPKNRTDALALSGLKKIMSLLNQCLSKAVSEDVISANPCNDVILPKETNIFIETKEQFSLNDNEILEFKNAALSRYKTTGEYKSRDGLVLLIILNLGLRVGEMTALRWRNVNIDDKIVKIQNTTQTLECGRRIKNTTKTPKGVRVIPLNESTLWYLNELKEYDKRKNIVSEFVACTNKGTQQSERNLQRSLDRITSWTRIGHISLHTLRHTFGSTLLRKKVPIEVVSKLMGHANITITFNKYIHVIQEEKAKAMQLVSVS